MRLSTRTLIRICRTIGIVLLAVGLMLVVSATSARAQERKNCPNGFVWERMSGQCCVQDRSTLPSHGKIGYTGNSLCQDGWYEVYDRRSTTDGEGVDGCPGYTSFVFLLECASSREEAQRRQAEVDAAAASNPLSPPSSTAGGGSGLNLFSDALYRSGGSPSPNDLALAGGAVAALLATLGLSTLRGSGGAALDRQTRDLLDQLRRNEREFEEAQRALDKANEERQAIERSRAELQRLSDELQARLDRLLTGIQQCDRNITIANYGKWTLAGLGLVAAIASFAAWAWAAPAAAPASASAGGMASLQAALGGLGAAVEKIMIDILAATAKISISGITFGGSLAAHFEWTGPWQRLKESTASLRTNASFLRGRVQGQIEDLNKAYDAADARVKEATANLDRIRAEGGRISQQISSP
jgi:peptidoglycan hydrolase CwlO-like protein